MSRPRDLELARAAEDDIAAILDHSAEAFGHAARRRYEVLIATGLQDLRSDPLRPTSLARPELQAGVRTYHLRHCRDRAATVEGAVRAPRHLLVYEAPTTALVRVLRVLHDAMELDRHIPAADNSPPGG